MYSLFDLCIINILKNKIKTDKLPDHLKEYFTKGIVICFITDNVPLIDYFITGYDNNDSATIFQSNNYLKQYISEIEYFKGEEGKKMFPKLSNGEGCLLTFVNLILTTKKDEDNNYVMYNDKKLRIDNFVVDNTSGCKLLYGKNFDFQFIRESIILSELVLHGIKFY